MAELLFKLPCLTSFPLFLHSLTSLFSSCLNLLFGTQQKPRRLKPFFLQIRNVGLGRDFVPGRVL